MKVSSKVPFTALSLFFLATGCSVFSDKSDDAEQHSDPGLPTPDRAPAPAAPPLDGTPVTSDLTEALGVFVVERAQAGGDGSRAHPFATINEGIDAAKKTGKRVYVCAGTYRESIVIADGISMVGGLDCSIATWAVGKGRSRIEATSIPAVTASSISTTTRFARFEVIAPDATTPGGSSIALFATAATLLTIEDVRLVAGNGAKGDDAVEPAPLQDGPDADGKAGPPEGPYCANGICPSFKIAIAGGAGGTSACGGGTGGVGGSGGVWEPIDSSNPSSSWQPYGNDASRYGAKAGTSPQGTITNGQDGASATATGTFTRDGFVPANGARGTNGGPGIGGRGGLGGAPNVSGFGKDVWYGIQGSGGGAGGCGGVAGEEGKGGGASLAAFIVDGSLSFIDTELVARDGGAGGRGAFGSAPTAGGKGGPAVANAFAIYGIAGKPGGEAGVSGSGAGGSSVALVHFGAKPSMERMKLVVGQAGKGVPAMTSGAKTIGASANGDAATILTFDQAI